MPAAGHQAGMQQAGVKQQEANYIQQQQQQQQGERQCAEDRAVAGILLSLTGITT
jgi:hypothetical protein